MDILHYTRSYNRQNSPGETSKLRFEASINPLWPGQKLGRSTDGEKRWGRHTGAFINEKHTLESFARRVCVDGAAFSAVLKHPWRKQGNFQSIQVLATDHDGASIATLLDDPFIQDHAAFLYETPSSTLLAPRSRVVFIIDQPIEDAGMARLAYRALIYHFSDGEPDQAADESCKDSTRFFYGNPNSRHKVLGNILYKDILQEQVIEPYLNAAPNLYAEGPEIREYTGDYNPHWGEPLTQSDKTKLARLLTSEGLRLDYNGVFRGPCILPHSGGGCDCPEALGVSSTSGSWHCFCSDHIGKQSGNVSSFAAIGFKPSSGAELTFQEMAQALGQSYKGPGEHTQKRPRAENVSNKGIVSKGKDHTLIRDKDPWWTEVVKLLPYPSVCPLVRGKVTRHRMTGRLHFFDVLSNVWKNPTNAQFKKRRILYNVLPRLEALGRPLYMRRVPEDDINCHGTLTKRVTRWAKQHGDASSGWLRVDNVLSRGYYLYITDAEDMPGFELCEDVKETFVEALRAIRPQGDEEEGRYRPFTGSDYWRMSIDSTGEVYRGIYESVGEKDGATNFTEVEVACITEGVKTHSTVGYHRSQWGTGMEMEDALPEEVAREMLATLGYKIQPGKFASQEVEAG